MGVGESVPAANPTPTGPPPPREEAAAQTAVPSTTDAAVPLPEQHLLQTLLAKLSESELSNTEQELLKNLLTKLTTAASQADGADQQRAHGTGAAASQAETAKRMYKTSKNHAEANDMHKTSTNHSYNHMHTPAGMPNACTKQA